MKKNQKKEAVKKNGVKVIPTIPKESSTKVQTTEPQTRLFKIYDTSTGPQVSLWGRYLLSYGFEGGKRIQAVLSEGKIEITLLNEGK